MKKLSLMVMLVLFLISLISFTYTQDSSKISGKWGVGISSPVFYTSSYQYIIPPAQNTFISVPIFITVKFKLEPFIGFSDYQYENEYEPSTITADRNETKYRYVTIGLGLFYSWPIKKTRIHFGGKLGYIKAKYEYKYENSGFSSSTEDKGSGYLFSPTVGGEYFFSDHISLGGEVNFEWSSVDSDGEDHDNLNVRKFSSTVKRFSTAGIVNIRVYFN